MTISFTFLFKLLIFEPKIWITLSFDEYFTTIDVQYVLVVDNRWFIYHIFHSWLLWEITTNHGWDFLISPCNLKVCCLVQIQKRVENLEGLIWTQFKVNWLVSALTLISLISITTIWGIYNCDFILFDEMNLLTNQLKWIKIWLISSFFVA